MIDLSLISDEIQSDENLDQFVLDEKHINQLSVFAEGNSYVIFTSIDITHHGYVFRIKKDGKCNEHKTDKLHYSADATARCWIPLRYQIKSSNLQLCPKFITSYNESSLLTSSSTITSTAYIERNLSYLHTTSATSTTSLPDQKTSHISSSDTLSFEFKVKCGFVSMAPTALLSRSGENNRLINLNNRLITSDNRLIKHQYGRFTLLQYSKLYETLYKSKSPRWGELQYSNNTYNAHNTHNIHNISLYNPLDLFSNDIMRTQSAIQHLLAYPQNNLKLLYNSNHIYGWNKYNINDAYTAFDQFIGKDAHEKGHNSDLTVIQIISKTLVNEELLSYICCLQALDVLDVEGMGCIYDFLTSLLLTSAIVPTNSSGSGAAPSTVEELLYEYINIHPTLMPLLKVIASYKLLYSDYINNSNSTYNDSNTEGSSCSNSTSKRQDNGIMDWSTYYNLHKGHNSDPSTATSEDDQHKILLLLQMMSYTASPPTTCMIESSTPLEDYNEDYHQPLKLPISMYEWISQLSIQDCLFILHCWLVSLCAKDISIVLTITKGNIMTSTTIDEPWPHTLPITNGSSSTTTPTDLSEPNPFICHIQVQTEDSYGIVRCYLPTSTTLITAPTIFGADTLLITPSTQHITPGQQEQYYDIHYRMTAIDLEGKPVTKLSQKILEEGAICAQAKYMINELRRDIHS